MAAEAYMSAKRSLHAGAVFASAPAANPASPWIAVSERLPEDRVRVLAWDHRLTGIATWYSSQWGSATLMPDDITHWMPLPAPPAEAPKEQP